MRSRIALIAALALASIAVSGCRYGHPGNASDHGHHRHGGDQNHDH
jgi:hypothetical protein